jgi:hypothetical protein
MKLVEGQEQDGQLELPLIKDKTIDKHIQTE